MPLQYQPFVSLYTDPGIKEISQDLKTRYYENLKAKDALAKSLDDMVALSPDEETKNKIRSEVDTQLEEIAKTPDLENKGFQIYDAVKSFDKKYTQVKKQYDASMAELQELEKKKEEGKVEPEYYDLVKANWFKNYKGVQFDDKGRLVQGTTFKAPTYYNSVDINEKLLKQLGILSPEENKSDIESFELSPDGTSYIAKKGNAETSISLDRVRSAYDAILQTPEIDRYINDKVDKRYNLIEGVDAKVGILQGYNTSLQTSNDEFAAQIEKNNTALATDNIFYGDKIQLENQNKKLQEVINENKLKIKTNLGYVDQLNQGKEGDAEQHIKSLLKQNELAPYKQYGDAKAFQSIAISEGIDAVSQQAKNQEAADARKWLMENPELKVTGNVTAATWGGIDTKAKKENIFAYQQTAKNLQEVLDKGKADGSLSTELINQYESQIQSSKNIAEDIQAQIDLAIEQSITIEDIKEILPRRVYETLKEMYPSNTTSKEQFLKKILDTFDREGDQDYEEFTKKYIDMFSEKNNLSKYTVIGGPTIMGTSDVNQKILEEGMGILTGLKSKIDEFISDKIDPAYKEIKQAPMFDMGAITSVSNDPAEVRRLTTGIQKYFTDKPIGENLKVTIQGSPGDDIASTEFNDAGVAELTGKDLSGYTVKKVGYQPISGSKGMFLVELSKGGDTPDNIVGLIDGQQLAGTELDKVVNRPEVSVARMINKLDPRNPNAAPRVRTVRLYDADGNIMTDRNMEVHVRTGESGSPEVAIGYNVNGNLTIDKWMPQNSETMIRLLNTKHANGKPMYELLD
jgi:hypothetical protein